MANFTSIKVSTHTGYTPASMAFQSDLPTSNARAITSHHTSLLPAVLFSTPCFDFTALGFTVNVASMTGPPNITCWRHTHTHTHGHSFHCGYHWHLCDYHSVFITHQTTRLWGQEPALVCSPLCRDVACSKYTQYISSKWMLMYVRTQEGDPSFIFTQKWKTFQEDGSYRGRKVSHLTLY